MAKTRPLRLGQRGKKYNTNVPDTAVPVNITAMKGQKIAQVHVAEEQSFAILENGQVFAWYVCLFFYTMRGLNRFVLVTIFDKG